ncbi:HSP20 family protein [Catalinimonas alkaloidigena]|uniref:HSP20 family protein n=1 Tax=Catalinimonas alkaloidigena TaxID=1075417 RepID=A0A1G9H999_9BACT|nr:Hsp20/alpha crystallin family protein [Catalinimonas alkaloidigena]SDL09581.1 HSP20 family protein [Catalinimonas alkaloidigena]
MNIVKRNPIWPSNTFFDDFLTRDLFSWPGSMHEGNTVPRVNIRETNDDFEVEMAAPGMRKEDFHVELNNDMLTIYAEVAQAQDEHEEERYTRREFSYRSFKRSFYLPNTVEVNKIKAKYRDGILSLVIPKKEEAKTKPPRVISIS